MMRRFFSFLKTVTTVIVTTVMFFRADSSDVSEQIYLRFFLQLVLYMQLVAPRVVANAVRTVMKNCKICFQVSFFIAIIF